MYLQITVGEQGTIVLQSVLLCVARYMSVTDLTEFNFEFPCIIV